MTYHLKQREYISRKSKMVYDLNGVNTLYYCSIEEVSDFDTNTYTVQKELTRDRMVLSGGSTCQPRFFKQKPVDKKLVPAQDTNISHPPSSRT